MSRNPKAPLSNEEVLLALKERRADALPLLPIPTQFDLRSPAAQFVVALSAVLHREQVWRLREIARRAKRPEIKSKQNAYNFLPTVEAKRKLSRHQRYYGNAGYREKVNRQGVEYFKANKERIYAYRKARKHLTAERDRTYIRDWQRNKRQTDPQYNIGNRLRSRIWHALSEGRIRKGTRTEALTGCTVAQLVGHIKGQFTDGMTWEAFLRGEIHIDHKKPCASFDLTDEAQQKACFHYTNLQPLWATDNLSKGARLLIAATQI